MHDCFDAVVLAPDGQHVSHPKPSDSFKLAQMLQGRWKPRTYSLEKVGAVVEVQCHVLVDVGIELIHGYCRAAKRHLSGKCKWNGAVFFDTVDRLEQRR